MGWTPHDINQKKGTEQRKGFFFSMGDNRFFEIILVVSVFGNINELHKQHCSVIGLSPADGVIKEIM